MYKKKNLEPYLCQGDIIINYPKDKLQSFSPDEFFKGIIILSYTCDLKNDKLDNINYSPIYDIENLITDIYNKLKNDDRIKKEIRKRKKEQKNPNEYIRSKVLDLLHRIFNYEDKSIFYLEADEIFNGKQCYAHLEQIYTMSLNLKDNKNQILDLIKNCCKASLTNPFIEKLGYMVGYCFNRVAIEVFDITSRNQIYDNKYKSRFEGLVNSILTQN